MWSSAAEPATTSPNRPLGLFALHFLYLENGSSCFPPALLRICLEYIRETHSHRGFKEMGVFFFWETAGPWQHGTPCCRHQLCNVQAHQVAQDGCHSLPVTDDIPASEGQRKDVPSREGKLHMYLSVDLPGQTTCEGSLGMRSGVHIAMAS